MEQSFLDVIVEVGNQLSAFYGTGKFINVFTKACQ
jgi:hypothetical protein